MIKKSNNLINLCSMLLCIIIAFITYRLNTIDIKTREILLISILVTINIVLTYSYGYKKDRHYLKESSVRSVIVFFMGYILITYLLGVILGFTNSYFIPNIRVEVKNILPIIMFILLIEYFRKIVYSSSINNKKIPIIITTITIGLSILYEINLGTLISSEDKFIFLCIMILPTIAEETLCSFMTYKISWIPSLVFKLLISLYMYIVPILPNLGNYIYSVVNIVLPFLIYYDINNTLIKYEKDKKTIKKYNLSIIKYTVLTILIILVIFVSGIFKYKMIAVASNSMHPIFNRGDAVIYEKVSTDLLNEGDVIAFKKDNIIVTHRIVKIWNKGNSKYYITKGDNNNSVDIYNPKDTDVLGVVKIKFKYIGYPTIIINELIRKE